MYPHTSYDEQNGLAYVALSGNEIAKSIESDDELFVLDLDQNGEIVGIEVLSVPRLQENYISPFFQLHALNASSISCRR